MNDVFNPLEDNDLTLTKIQPLNEIVNFDMLPIEIYNLFYNDIREELWDFREVGGELKWGKTGYKTPFRYFDFGNFYMLEEVYRKYIEVADKQQLYHTKNGKDILLNGREEQMYFRKYAEGFHKGYQNLTSKYSNHIGMDITYIIFSRATATNAAKGSFIQESIPEPLFGKRKKPKLPQYFLSESLMFNAGINGGEYYKAWEIILQSPNLYKKHFVSDKESDYYSDEIPNETIANKVIYLYALGIIDYLRKHPDFSMSTNMLAKALSPIVSEKPVSLQSALNALISNSDRNPLNNSKNVAKVKNHLKSMGYNKKDTI